MAAMSLDERDGPSLPHAPESLRILTWIAAAAAALTVAWLARTVLIPLVIALGALVLITALAKRIGEIPIGGRRLPPVAAGAASVIAITLIGIFIALYVGRSIAGVVASAPVYQERLTAAAQRFEAWTGIDVAAITAQAFRDVDVQAMVIGAVSAVSDIASASGLVIVFLGFMLVEQRHLARKMRLIAGGGDAARTAEAAIERIGQSVTRYIATKTAIATAMGFSGFVILAIAGVDHAAFWGFVIFLLDFIPTIGSLSAVLLATLAALAQFGEPGPALGVGVALGALQIVLGNVVEPRLMGTSLNLSPLAVILALSVWGLLWGVTGLFLAVPLTGALVIVCAEFAATRWLAIALSFDGRVGKD